MKATFMQVRSNLAAAVVLGALFGAAAHSADTAPQLLITLTVNGKGDARVVAGWPVLAEVQITNANAFDRSASATPVILSAGSNAWSDLVRFHITDATNRSYTLPFTLITQTGSSIQLGTGNVGMLTFALSPDKSLNWTPGTYQVSVEVAGFGSSPASTITVTTAPAALSADQIHWKYMLEAGYDGARGRFEAAVARLDRLISEQPQDVVAMELKGDLLSAAGRKAEAANAYETAVEVWAQLNPNPQEAPVSLLHKLNSNSY